jgi:hypothetical protein
LVEHATENRSVGGSIPPLGTIGFLSLCFQRQTSKINDLWLPPCTKGWWCFEIADECLVAHGLRVDEAGRSVLAGAVAAALQRASVTLASLSKGGIPSVNFFSTTVGQLPVVSRPPVVFKQLVDGWAAERRPVPKTQYEWSRVVRQLEAYLGHSDPHRLTGENLVEWKNSMIEAGLRPKTIQDAKLAPLRAILQWGVQNKLISACARCP